MILTDYIASAFRHAHYEVLEEGGYYGEIRGLDGVYATAPMLEECRTELQSALEDWLLFSLVNGFRIPPIDGVELSASRVA